MAMLQDGQIMPRLLDTRAAVRTIEHDGIRADLERFVDGAEVCLEYEEFALAVDVVRSIVATVVALDRTIGPEVHPGDTRRLGCRQRADGAASSSKPRLHQEPQFQVRYQEGSTSRIEHVRRLTELDLPDPQ